MTLAFGEQRMEIREWPDGRALLMTRDERLKRKLLEAMDDAPDALELMSDPDVERCPEDTEGLLLAVADRQHISIILDLEDMLFEVGIVQEDE